MRTCTSASAVAKIARPKLQQKEKKLHGTDMSKDFMTHVAACNLTLQYPLHHHFIVSQCTHAHNKLFILFLFYIYYLRRDFPKREDNDEFKKNFKLLCCNSKS
jgi:hypothetical protein